MKYIKVESGLIVKSWCDAPEEGAIEQAIRGVSDLDEAAGAYKDIDTVIDDYENLPVGCVPLRSMTKEELVTLGRKDHGEQ